MTPEEAFYLANQNQGLSLAPADEKRLQDFISSAQTRDVQKFIHGLSNNGRAVYFNLAITELDIRFSEQSAKSSKILERYTRWIIALTIALVIFALPDFIKMLSGFCH
jgi:hypothetical protein